MASILRPWKDPLPLSTSTEPFTALCRELLDVDLNAALVVLKAIPTDRNILKRHATDFGDFLIDTITNCRDESIRIVAIDGLVDILENCDAEDGLAIMSRFDSLRNNLAAPGNRRSWNSKTRLRCTILRLNPLSTITAATCLLNCELCACLKACSLALEETVGHMIYSLPLG